MAIRLNCSCGASYKCKTKLAGKAFKCMSCGASLTVPEGDESHDESAAAREPAEATSEAAEAPHDDEAGYRLSVGSDGVDEAFDPFGDALEETADVEQPASEATSGRFFLATANMGTGGTQIYRCYPDGRQLLFVCVAPMIFLVDVELGRKQDGKSLPEKLLQSLYFIVGLVFAGGAGFGALSLAVSRVLFADPSKIVELVSIVSFTAALAVPSLLLMTGWLVTRIVRRARKLDALSTSELRNEAESDPWSFSADSASLSGVKLRSTERGPGCPGVAILTFKHSDWGKWKFFLVTEEDRALAKATLRLIRQTKSKVKRETSAHSGGKRKAFERASQIREVAIALSVLAGIVLSIVVLVNVFGTGASDDTTPEVADGSDVIPHGADAELAENGPAAAADVRRGSASGYTPLPDGYELATAAAHVPEGLTAIKIIDQAQPAENWGVTPDSLALPELAAAWLIDPGVDLDENVLESVMSPKARWGGILAAPNDGGPASWYRYDLTKEGKPVSVVQLDSGRSSLPTREELSKLSREEVKQLAAQRRRQAGVGAGIGPIPRFWTTRTERRVVAALGPEGAAVAVLVKERSQAQVWDADGGEGPTFDAPAGETWTAAGFFGGGELCLLASSGLLRKFDTASAEVLREIKTDWRGNLVLSPTQTYLVGWTGDGFEWRSVETLDPVGKLSLPAGLLTRDGRHPQATVSSDGARFAATLDTQRGIWVLAWDVGTGRLTDAYTRSTVPDATLQWAGPRLLVLGSEEPLVLDLDRRAIVYRGVTDARFSARDDRVWRMELTRYGNGKQAYERLTGNPPRHSEIQLLLAGAPLPAEVVDYYRRVEHLPINPNLPARVEVAGHPKFAPEKFADVFAQWLAMQGHTVDPGAEAVYRIFLRCGLDSVNYTDVIQGRGSPALTLAGQLDFGERHSKGTMLAGSLGWVSVKLPNPPINPVVSVAEIEAAYPKEFAQLCEKFVQDWPGILRGASVHFGEVGNRDPDEGLYLARNGDQVELNGLFPVDGLPEFEVRLPYLGE